MRPVSPWANNEGDGNRGSAKPYAWYPQFLLVGPRRLAGTLLCPHAYAAPDFPIVPPRSGHLDSGCAADHSLWPPVEA